MISEQVASEGGDATEGQMPAPLNPGQEAELITESEASAPASAPQAVKDAIAAANSIATTPYIWGGGHGSFESSGYDCSGAVSFALHGGGLLESPLDSTGLETWGEPGPGRWITVYANAGHAWMVDRRHRLRHQRRRRPPLARPLGRLPRRLHRPSPRWALVAHRFHPFGPYRGQKGGNDVPIMRARVGLRHGS